MITKRDLAIAAGAMAVTLAGVAVAQAPKPALLGPSVWRWDEMAVSDCAISRHYQLHLLHFPCHQGLDAAQLEWMARIVDAVIRISAGGGR